MGTDYALGTSSTLLPACFAHLCPRFAQRVQSHYVSLCSVWVRTLHLARAQRSCLRASHTYALALLNVCSRTTFRFAREHRLAHAIALCSCGNRRFPRRNRTVTPKMPRLNALPFSRLHTRLAHFAPVEIEDFHVAIVVLNALSQRKLVIAPTSALCFRCLLIILKYFLYEDKRYKLLQLRNIRYILSDF